MYFEYFSFQSRNKCNFKDMDAKKKNAANIEQ